MSTYMNNAHYREQTYYRTLNSDNGGGEDGDSELIWPLEHIDELRVSHLVEAGLIYTPTPTNPYLVQCFHCKTSITISPTTALCPYTTHLKASPACQWAQCSTQHVLPISNSNPLSTSLTKSRTSTFDLGSGWPYNKKRNWKPTKTRLVSAGFYFDPLLDEPDAVVCVCCRLTMSGWAAEDDPLLCHREERPNCEFLIKFDEKEREKEIRKSKKGKKEKENNEEDDILDSTIDSILSNSSSVVSTKKISASSSILNTSTTAASNDISIPEEFINPTVDDDDDNESNTNTINSNSECNSIISRKSERIQKIEVKKQKLLSEKMERKNKRKLARLELQNKNNSNIVTTNKSIVSNDINKELIEKIKGIPKSTEIINIASLANSVVTNDKINKEIKSNKLINISNKTNEDSEFNDIISNEMNEPSICSSVGSRKSSRIMKLNLQRQQEELDRLERKRLRKLARQNKNKIDEFIKPNDPIIITSPPRSVISTSVSNNDNVSESGLVDTTTVTESNNDNNISTDDDDDDFYDSLQPKIRTYKDRSNNNINKRRNKEREDILINQPKITLSIKKSNNINKKKEIEEELEYEEEVSEWLPNKNKIKSIKSAPAIITSIKKEKKNGKRRGGRVIDDDGLVECSIPIITNDEIKNKKDNFNNFDDFNIIESDDDEDDFVPKVSKVNSDVINKDQLRHNIVNKDNTITNNSSSDITSNDNLIEPIIVPNNNIITNNTNNNDNISTIPPVTNNIIKDIIIPTNNNEDEVNIIKKSNKRIVEQADSKKSDKLNRKKLRLASKVIIEDVAVNSNMEDSEIIVTRINNNSNINESHENKDCKVVQQDSQLVSVDVKLLPSNNSNNSNNLMELLSVPNSNTSLLEKISSNNDSKLTNLSSPSEPPIDYDLDGVNNVSDLLTPKIVNNNSINEIIPNTINNDITDTISNTKSPKIQITNNNNNSVNDIIPDTINTNIESPVIQNNNNISIIPPSSSVSTTRTIKSPKEQAIINDIEIEDNKTETVYELPPSLSGLTFREYCMTELVGARIEAIRRSAEKQCSMLDKILEKAKKNW